MPDDSGGIYTVPAGTIVNTGDTLLPSQHNPWALDNASAVSARFSKDGRAPATGDWNLNTFRITGLGTPTGANDATSKTYVDNAVTTQGFLWGLTMSNNATDAVNDIDITAGAAGADTTPFVTMRLASAITKRLDAVWAVGTGNGGRMSAAAIADVTYHVWLIQRSDTGVVDVGFDVSPTAPTMPANYDRKRRIGSIIRVAGALRLFRQNGNFFKYVVPVTDRNSISPTTATPLGLSVPNGVRVQPLLLAQLIVGAVSDATISFGDGDGAGTDIEVLVRVINQAAGGPSGSFGWISGGIFTNTTTQVYFAQLSSAGTINTAVVVTQGWIDDRGQSL